jgi:hypothetical protein
MNDAKGLTMGVTPPMTGKTALITGGIGRATAIGLASMGARKCRISAEAYLRPKGVRMSHPKPDKNEPPENPGAVPF